MCRLFASQDPQTYAPETRAIRLNGHATSVRLEAAFWEILEEIAADEATTVARFISALHDEVLVQRGEVSNLASLLRVSCTLYLRNRDMHRAAPRENLLAVA
jgi:predicted DNA-binding ribbon-helix-helix protein